ncbi:MAG: SDR family NAD(P)-dependent oxidoreductase [Woeseiaceae bacterium]|nr:SDR family NAD(P)-dependent oxidoreductase [Woeseiaceae bacterium]
MTLLSSFSTDANVAVIGASGGIGDAFVRLLASDESVAKIHAFSRTASGTDLPKVTTRRIQLEDESTIAAAAADATSEAPLDLVFVASGMLWRGDTLRPEKSMRDMSIDGLSQLFAINAAGPALVAKHFLPTLGKRSKTLFAALSARVGSIGDNRLGGWYSYRASKAALNMLLRTLAIEHARQWPQSVVAGLHPGTVDTPLSSPFTSRTPPGQLFSPETSARHLLKVMDKLGPDDSGAVFAWDGKRIEF